MHYGTDTGVDFSPRCTAPFLVEFPLRRGGKVFEKGHGRDHRVIYEYATPASAITSMLIPSFSASPVISVAV